MAPVLNRPLGEILLQARVIRQDQLERALALQGQEGIRLGQALVRLGFATEDDVAWALSSQLGLPYVHLRPELVDPAAVRLLPADVQRHLCVLPLLASEGELSVAVADPTDRAVLAEVHRLTGLRPNPVVALESNIREVLEQVLASMPTQASGDLALRLALSDAAQKGATHVYVDPLPGRAVRFSYRTAAGVFPGEGPSIPWELLEEVGRRPPARRVLHLEVVLASKAVEAVLHAVDTRWGVALAGPLVPLPEDPVHDPAGLPAEAWSYLESALEPWGVVVVACPDLALRRRVLRFAAARLASRWGGVVVLAGATGTRPVPGVVESPARDALTWQRARPDALVAEASSPRQAAALALATGPGQRVVLGIPGWRASHARSFLAKWPPGSLRGVLSAVPLPALCSCALTHDTPYEPWPVGEPPRRWASPQGCEVCRYSGFAGQAVAFEWEPARGAPIPLECTARQLVEAGRVSPQQLVPLLEG